MESVQDLTDSAHWRQMPLNEKLDCVAKALYELPDPRKYLPTRCFDHVRIFVYDSGTRQFALNCAAGFSSHPVIGAPVDLSGSQRLKRAEDHMRNEQYGYYFPEDFPADVLSQPGKSERVIYWPIIADRVTIALLEAVGNQCDIDSVDLLRPYAKKIVEILENQQEDAPDTPTSEAADALAKIDLRLQTETDPSPRKALKLLVRECCTLTESVFPVLRYREQEDAVLVRLGLSQYDDHARFRFPLVEMTSWSARTILSGQMQIADTRHNRDAVLEMRNHMKSDARDFLNEIRSLCFLPLLLDGRCIGSLGLHSTSTVNFSAEKVDLARSIAGRVAFALHDYLVEHGIRREIEEAKEATIGLVLHNINTPLATLNNELEYLLGEVHADSADRGSLESGLGRIKAQSERIARIRSEYFKLHEPWTSRIEKVNPSEFLVRVSQECGKGMPVELRDERSRKTERVCLDKTGLRVCIEVLIGNGVDALLDAPAPRMVLTIREATAAESEMADSPDSILGIDVEDNGPGVPPQIQKGLFRIIKSAKSRGLGFGLSFCRYVAISAGGNVYFHSNYSNGARFTLLLPYKLIP
jgi:signal transduction histidine kinase